MIFFFRDLISPLTAMGYNEYSDDAIVTYAQMRFVILFAFIIRLVFVHHAYTTQNGRDISQRNSFKMSLSPHFNRPFQYNNFI